MKLKIAVLLWLLSAEVQALSQADSHHLALRTGFALEPAQYARWQGLTRQQAVRQVLGSYEPEKVVRLPGWLRTPGAPIHFRQLSASQKKQAQKAQRQQGWQLKGWWLNQMIATRSPFTERMLLFWHNHFTSSLQKVKDPVMIYAQHRLLRQQGLGSFRQLLTAIARDPAMLRYLDNRSNVKGKPNENFARELLELFTLGEGNYTEADVKAAARAFTGWGIDHKSRQFRFNPRRHDQGGKLFMGHRGNWGGEDILRMLLSDPRTAETVVVKAWRAFISPQPDPARVVYLARQFRTADYNIRTLMRLLLNEPAFWAVQNRGVLIKSPLMLMAGLGRTFQLRPGRHAVQLARQSARMGQDPFNPPNVKGWPGGVNWISSQSLLLRQQLLAGLGRKPAKSSMMATKRGPRPDYSAQLAAFNRRVPDADKARWLLALPPAQPQAGQSGKALTAALLQDPVYQLY